MTRPVLLCASVVAAIIIGLFLIPIGRAFPHDHSRPDLDGWFRSLHDANGRSCCDGTDAKQLQDVDWRGEPDGTYSVRIDGKWWKLEDYQILKEPNRLGVAVVFIYMGKITCFIAGSGT